MSPTVSVGGRAMVSLADPPPARLTLICPPLLVEIVTASVPPLASTSATEMPLMV